MVRGRLAAPRVAVVALCVLVGIVLLSGTVHRLVLLGLEDARRMAAAQPAAAMALVVLFSALAAMLTFVSSWVLVPFAVFTWGATTALLLLWSGWLLGGAATYAIGRFLGPPAVRWLVRGDRLTRYGQRFARHMPFYLVLLIQLSLPSEIPGYLLGTVHYSFVRYLVALGIVEVAYGLVTVYLGQSVVERHITPVITALTVLALITVSAAYGLRKRMQRQPIA
ncbi:MAG TPA: VTT domain-containing protein [Gemmatimonadales bacterium]|nr:VTT domain-containing protein [Gemmatimonadales bacterium]